MILTIHSFKGGTGKTFLALNLAYLLSRKYRVCLIDFDFRAPSLHVFFGGNVRYVNELLEGSASVEDCIIRLSKNLSVMLSSPNPEDIKREMRRSDRDEMRILERLIELKSELDFDYVILDTSPGLSYRSINALLISDLMLLVVRADKVDLEGFKTLLNVIKHVETPKFVVLNRVTGNVDLSFGLPVVAKIPCSCDVTMDHPFFVERFPDHEVTRSLRVLADFVMNR